MIDTHSYIYIHKWVESCSTFSCASLSRCLKSRCFPLTWFRDVAYEHLFAWHWKQGRWKKDVYRAHTFRSTVIFLFVRAFTPLMTSKGKKGSLEAASLNSFYYFFIFLVDLFHFFSLRLDLNDQFIFRIKMVWGTFLWLANNRLLTCDWATTFTSRIFSKKLQFQIVLLEL